MPTAIQIKKYLEKTGWVHKHTTRVNSLVYGHTGYRDSVLVPTDKGLGDYKDLLSDLLQHIADYENEEVPKIEEKIQFLLKDVLRFRSDSPLARDGTLPLQAWEKHFDFTLRSIKVAASCIVKPTSAIKRLNSKDAASFASRCRIGQTEFGSYITKAIIPLGEYQESIHEENKAAKEPPGRQLSSSIISSAHVIANASRDLHNRGETEEFKKFNENKSLASICERMCSAFEDISAAFHDKLNLSISLAPSIDLPNVPVSIQASATIASDLIAEVREIRSVIVKRFIPKKENITGFVTNLNQDTYKNDIQEGSVTIFDGTKKVYARFNVEMYNAAIEAHKSKRPVSLTGTLHKEKRKFYLVDPSDFLIL